MKIKQSILVGRSYDLDKAAYVDRLKLLVKKICLNKIIWYFNDIKLLLHCLDFFYRTL